MMSFARDMFDRPRQIALVAGVLALVVVVGGVISTASAYPGPVDSNCPATGPCETVIQATDGNTYYADNLGGGHGYVVQVGSDGNIAETIEITASQDQITLAHVERGRRLVRWAQDQSKTGIFAEGSSSDVPVNTVNVNGNGYIEFAAVGDQPAGIAVQVIGGDGQVFAGSIRFNRGDPKLQSAFKDYMQGAATLNSATARLRAFLTGVGGFSAIAVSSLISGVQTKTFSEANMITSVAAIASLTVAGLVQLYNAWRDVDSARNNLINLYNNLHASAGRDVLPIPMVTFGGISAQSVTQNHYHSFRLP